MKKRFWIFIQVSQIVSIIKFHKVFMQSYLEKYLLLNGEGKIKI